MHWKLNGNGECVRVNDSSEGEREGYGWQYLNIFVEQFNCSSDMMSKHENIYWVHTDSLLYVDTFIVSTRNIPLAYEYICSTCQIRVSAVISYDIILRGGRDLNFWLAHCFGPQRASHKSVSCGSRYLRIHGVHLVHIYIFAQLFCTCQCPISTASQNFYVM